MAAGFFWQRKMIYFPDRKMPAQDQIHMAGLRFWPDQHSNQTGDYRGLTAGDVSFDCNQGLEIADLVTAVAQSGERVQMPIHIEATVPDLGDDPVAKFTLTLSLKKEIP